MLKYKNIYGGRKRFFSLPSTDLTKFVWIVPCYSRGILIKWSTLQKKLIESYKDVKNITGEKFYGTVIVNSERKA